MLCHVMRPPSFFCRGQGSNRKITEEGEDLGTRLLIVCIHTLTYNFSLPASVHPFLPSLSPSPSLSLPLLSLPLPLLFPSLPGREGGREGGKEGGREEGSEGGERSPSLSLSFSPLSLGGRERWREGRREGGRE